MFTTVVWVLLVADEVKMKMIKLESVKIPSHPSAVV